MRILVSANGPDWDATIAPAFDTAPYSLLIDTASESCTPLAWNKVSPFAPHQIEAIITDHLSVEIMQSAVQAGVRLYTIPAGGIRIAIDQYLRGKRKSIQPVA